jgi:hypothetical protein
VASFDRLDRVAKTAVVKFTAYADQADRQLGNIQPVDYHTITISGAAFDSFFSTTAATTANAYAQAYAMAKVTPDNAYPPFPVGGPAPVTLPAPVIFFATALDV